MPIDFVEEEEKAGRTKPSAIDFIGDEDVVKTGTPAAGPEQNPTGLNFLPIGSQPADAGALLRGINAIPGLIGRAGAGLASTIKQVVDPRTYLPEQEAAAARPFVIDTTGGEIRPMSRQEELAREPFAPGRSFLPAPRTQLDPESSDLMRQVEALSTPENITILAAGGGSKLAGGAILASMAPQIWNDVKEVAAGDLSPDQKRDKINSLVVPLFLGLRHMKPDAAEPAAQDISGPSKGDTMAPNGPQLSEAVKDFNLEKLERRLSVDQQETLAGLPPEVKAILREQAHKLNRLNFSEAVDAAKEAVSKPSTTADPPREPQMIPVLTPTPQQQKEKPIPAPEGLPSTDVPIGIQAAPGVELPLKHGEGAELVDANGRAVEQVTTPEGGQQWRLKAAPVDPKPTPIPSRAPEAVSATEPPAETEAQAPAEMQRALQKEKATPGTYPQIEADIATWRQGQSKLKASFRAGAPDNDLWKQNEALKNKYSAEAAGVPTAEKPVEPAAPAVTPAPDPTPPDVKAEPTAVVPAAEPFEFEAAPAVEPGRPKPSGEPDKAAPSAPPDSISQSKTKQPPTQRQSEPETAPVETPAPQLQAEVSKVAKNKGQIPAKEVKSKLVSRLESALKEAPAEADLTPEQSKALREAQGDISTEQFGYGSRADAEKDKYIALERARRLKATEATGVKVLKISIPGDGNFRVINTKEAIQQVLKDAKRIETKPMAKKAAELPGPRKPDSARAINDDVDRAVAIYGNPIRAAKVLQAQLDRSAELELPAEQVSKLNQIVARLNTRAFQRVRDAEKTLNNTKDLIAYFRGKIEAITPEELKESQFARSEKKRFESKLKSYQEDLPKAESEYFQAKQQLEEWGHKTPEETTTAPGDKPPVGMGGAVAAEFEGGPNDYVSNMFAAIDRDRVERGLEPMEPTQPRTWDQDNSRALAEMNRNPNWIPNLINEVLERPRPLMSWENAGLVWHRAKLKAEANNAFRRVNQAFEDGREGDRVAAQNDAERFENELETLDRAVGRGGTGSEAGRSLQAQKMAAGEDWTLVEMRMRARAGQGGKPLSPEQEKVIEDLSRQLSATKAEYEDYKRTMEQRLKDLESTRTHDEMVREPKKPMGPMEPKPGAYRDAVLEKIRERLGQDPPEDISNLVQKLARYFIKEEGITDREAVIDAVHNVLKDIIPGLERRETMDMISGYGKYKQLSKDQISIKLRGMKGEMQQLAKLEDMAKGQPPLKTGLERRIPTDAERALIKEVNDAKFKFQIPVADPRVQLKSALDQLKTTLRNRIVDYEERLRTGDFAKRQRRQLQLDRDALRLKATYERVKQKFDRQVKLLELKNRTPTARTADWITRWRRAFVLSWPTVLGKLVAAAALRAAVTPAEELVGGAIGVFFPKVARIAPREGGVNLRAEARAISQGLTMGMRDSWQVLRTGQSDLDVLYGKAALLPPVAADFFGHIHGALKAPVKRAEFERSLQKRTEAYLRQGIDVTDELVQTRLLIDSYKDAERAIFQQDNRLVTAYKRFLSGLEQPSKVTGQVPFAGRAMGTFARISLPIVKVPTNIVAETLTYALGPITGGARLARAFARGFDNLKPEEADLIMRHLKKGSLGWAFLALGFLSPQAVGGYYQRGEKRKAGEVKAGGIRLFDTDIPRYLVHNPLMEVLQIGATWRRVAESRINRNDPHTQGLGAGLLASALGVTEEVPFVRETVGAAKAWDPRSQGQFFGELSKSLVVPGAIQWLTQPGDLGVQQALGTADIDAAGNAVQRKVTGPLEGIKSGIPIIREDLPRKPRRQ